MDKSHFVYICSCFCLNTVYVKKLADLFCYCAAFLQESSVKCSL